MYAITSFHYKPNNSDFFIDNVENATQLHVMDELMQHNRILANSPHYITHMKEEKGLDLEPTPYIYEEVSLSGVHRFVVYREKA